TALTMYEEMFGRDHGRLAFPLSRRAAARVAGGNEAGARQDLERAVVVIDRYDGPPLQPPRLRFELAKLLPPDQRERAEALVADAREDLERARTEAGPSLVAEVDALELEVDTWAAGR
ncbi:MAG: hypothetical protein AB1Z98_27430, partial [Nannocystaceae bacterium]